MITHLSPDLINKIAAGEVVERPASAVKELVENALDAQSTHITVDIEQGGLRLIRVKDNGVGMSSRDAQKSVLRYATSKIASLEDLAKIATLGFRGEALAAISSVSMFSLQTKQHGTLEGTEIIVKGNDAQEQRVCGCPDGTTVAIRNLFFNVPARRKFIKSERTEFNQILDIMTQFALCWPGIAWTFTHNAKPIFNVPATDSWRERIVAVLGADSDPYLMPIDHAYEGVTLKGFVAHPDYARGNRKSQYLFVNNRSVFDVVISSAIKRALEPSLQKGMYPAFICAITIAPTEIDVNVHPRKLEIKFADTQLMYSLMYNAVKEAFLKASVVLSSKTYEIPQTNVASSLVSVQSSPGISSRSAYTPQRPSFGSVPRTAQVKQSLAFTEVVLGKEIESQTRFLEQPVTNTEENFRVIGQLKKSYIVVQTQGSLVLYDQHAAAEALLFKKLKEQSMHNAVQSQKLLTPLHLDFSIGDAQLVTGYTDVFSSLGFEIEPFGGNSFVVYAVPVEIVKYDASKVISGIIQDIQQEVGLDARAVDAKKDIVLKYTACLSSVKFGDTLTLDEQARLIRDALSEQVTHCPHGRPIRWELSWHELEKKFKR